MVISRLSLCVALLVFGFVLVELNNSILADRTAGLIVAAPFGLLAIVALLLPDTKEKVYKVVGAFIGMALPVLGVMSWALYLELKNWPSGSPIIGLGLAYMVAPLVELILGIFGYRIGMNYGNRRIGQDV